MTDPSLSPPPPSAQLPDAGVIPPLVTPMLPDHTPDLDSLDNLIDYVLAAGATGLLVLGSTGENGLLSSEERLTVAGHVVARCAGRTHVMVGVPALGLKDARIDAVAYAALGAGTLLVPAPYGFIHTHDEFVEYFGELDAATGATPIVAYNVPSRVGVNLEPALIIELAESGVIAGLKDSSGNIEAQRVIADGTASIVGFRRYTGGELSIDAALLGGFHGAVPGLSNAFIHHHVALCEHAANSDWRAAAAVQSDIVSLARLYDAPRGRGSFSGVAIGALKEALVQLGVIAHSTTSAPFNQLDEGIRQHVADVLAVAKNLRR